MEWDPTQFFRSDEVSRVPFNIVVLNQPINETALTILRKHAVLTVCADGGANRFYDWMKSHGRQDTDLPDVIIGDLDSIHPNVKNHYHSLGVQIIQDEDQYSTDFMKSLNYLRSRTAGKGAGANESLSTLILGGLGGRVDQAFSQVHHLYLMSQFPSSSSTATAKNQQHDGLEEKVSNRGGGGLYLISEESITFVLQPGKNVIRTPRTNRPGREGEEEYLLEENVGIIPLSGPARISTRGFQWDVQDWKTEIGGKLSTSNHIRDDVVQVESRVPVLFTVELAERLKRVGTRSI